MARFRGCRVRSRRRRRATLLREPPGSAAAAPARPRTGRGWASAPLWTPRDQAVARRTHAAARPQASARFGTTHPGSLQSGGVHSWADVAQLAEHITRNDGVLGSIPSVGSKDIPLRHPGSPLPHLLRRPSAHARQRLTSERVGHSRERAATLPATTDLVRHPPRRGASAGSWLSPNRCMVPPKRIEAGTRGSDVPASTTPLRPAPPTPAAARPPADRRAAARRSPERRHARRRRPAGRSRRAARRRPRPGGPRLTARGRDAPR